MYIWIFAMDYCVSIFTELELYSGKKGQRRGEGTGIYIQVYQYKLVMHLHMLNTKQRD